MDERGPDAATIGKRLFGRPARLSLGIYFATNPGASYLSEICDRLRLPQSAVSQELTNFVELGLLDKHQVEGMRRIYYLRLPSPWWPVFEAAASILAADEAAHHTPGGGGP